LRCHPAFAALYLRSRSEENDNSEPLRAKLRTRPQSGEHLNADMKHAIGAKVPARTKSKLKAAAEEHMK
jgi:hypothetical protein